MSSELSQSTSLVNDQKSEQKKLRVNIGIPGNKFSGNFMISIIQSIYELWRSGSYDVSIIQGHNNFSPHSRMNTLGSDILRGKDQKPTRQVKETVLETR